MKYKTKKPNQMTVKQISEYHIVQTHLVNHFNIMCNEMEDVQGYITYLFDRSIILVSGINTEVNTHRLEGFTNFEQLHKTVIVALTNNHM